MLVIGRTQAERFDHTNLDEIDLAGEQILQHNSRVAGASIESHASGIQPNIDSILPDDVRLVVVVGRLRRWLPRERGHTASYRRVDHVHRRQLPAECLHLDEVVLDAMVDNGVVHHRVDPELIVHTGRQLRHKDSILAVDCGVLPEGGEVLIADVRDEPLVDSTRLQSINTNNVNTHWK